MLLLYISAATGAATILASLWLIAKKRITLDRISANPSIQQDAIKAEIFNLIKISSHVPAIALFIIGLLLIVIPIYQSAPNATVYRVTGEVLKGDERSPRDVSIMTQFPPLFPTSRGNIVGLKVWRGPDGGLPTLTFAHPNYALEAVDLNNRERVTISGDEIHINNPVELLPLPDGSP